MSNGLQKLISKVDNCSTTTCAETLSKLGNVTDIISSTNYDSVASAASLPTAACNTGRFMAITGGTEVCYRYSNGTDWTNDYTSCEVSTRQLFMWGDNTCGILGTGDTTPFGSPVTTAGGGTTWCTVSTGGYGHTLGIKTDGTLWAWGCSGSGRLGTNELVDRSSPVTTSGGGTNWKSVSAGTYSSVALKTDGTVWNWGEISTTSSPVSIVGGGTNWCRIFPGFDSFFAVKTDGTLWGWGLNNGGKLGDGTTTATVSPVTTAGGGTNWCYAAGGDGHGLGVKTDGTLWSWGENFYGELGTNDGNSYSSPVTVAGNGTTWCSATAGAGFSLAIKTDGTLWGWGYNGRGQYATGDMTSYSSPVTTAGGGTNWCQVDAGRCFAGAVKTDGTLWTWGANNSSQLGDCTLNDRSSPATVCGGGNNWCYLSNGWNQVAAIKYAYSKGF